MEIISRKGSLNQDFVIKSMPSQPKCDKDDNFDTSYDSNSLIFYNRLKIISTVILTIGHVIFCYGLFYPILELNDGIYYDHSIFVPHSETLLHSLTTLFEHKSYLTLVVALVFSVSLPFVKIVFTLYAVYKSTLYKHSAVKVINSVDYVGVEKLRGLERMCYWIFFSLKCVCKYQYVDSVIIMFNVVLLRNDFIVASTGRGVACLIIYCLISVPTTQIIYYAFSEESKILKRWMGEEDKEDNTASSYVAEKMLVVFFTLLILFSSSVVLSQEKLIFVGFTVDVAKNLIIAGSDYSYLDAVRVLHDGNLYLFSFFIFMILGVIIPIAQVILFLFGIVLYNFHSTISGVLRFSGFDIGSCFKIMLFKWARFALIVTQILSDWACADVVALALICARSSLVTASRVVSRIPPCISISAFYMLILFGVSSFCIQILLNHKFVQYIIDEYEIKVEEVGEKDDDIVRITSLHSNLQENGTNFTNVDVPNGVDDMNSTSYVDGPIAPQDVGNKYGKSIFFISKFLFYIAITVIIAISIICAYKHKVSPVVLDLNTVQNFMDVSKYEIFEAVQKRLPASMGTCSLDDVKAPEPCTSVGSIYTLDKIVYFNIPWISGLDSLRLKSATVKPDGDRVLFDFVFNFGSLSIYSVVGSYILTYYHELYRGYDACCGTDVGMNVEISLKCSDSEPVISGIMVKTLHLSNVHLGKMVERVVNTFVDVRKLMDSKIKEEANKFLDPNDKFIYYQSMDMSIQDLLNYIVKINAPVGLVCKKDTSAPIAQ